MDPAQVVERLKKIEDRLTWLESRVSPAAAPGPAAAPSQAQAAAQARVTPASAPRDQAEDRPSLVTNILGWGGAIALLLAAAYLIRLAIDSGWLTPLRQVAMAAVAGLVLIGAGFPLRNANRQYAGLLPAAGIAILFLSVYGAHLYYGLVGPKDAAVAVILVCAASLWLSRPFASDLFALFAVAGSYSAPLLVSSLGASVTDLVIYFSAWSVVFSIFAVWRGRRAVYLLALYLALILFDFMWRNRAPGEWVPALIFQTIQLLVFGVAAATFSIRRDEPMTTSAALPHLPPLLIFYFLQYSLLDTHLPYWAPWIAVASAAFVAGLYGVARAALSRPLPGGELILWSYVALVLFHAGYLESVPKHWAPWVAFVLVPVAAALSLRRGTAAGGSWPVWVAVGVIFAVNYLRVLFETDVQAVPARQALAVIYALLLYAGYYMVRGGDPFRGADALLLYAGHISAMAAALHLLDAHIVESTAWGLLALACLGLSLWQKDRLLGQSSLLVFGATAGKVLLYDLSGAPPVARIVSLVVLGFTFYFGGLLYQRMLSASTEPAAR
jgi:uncharacterized membrane protein